MICLICNKEVKYIGQHIRLAHKEITQQQYYDKYIHETTGICPICGKSTRFIGAAKGYKEYCSQKCAVKDPKIKMLISEKTKAATEDIKKRNQEKYGCDWITQTDEFKQKSKETSVTLHSAKD